MKKNPSKGMRVLLAVLDAVLLMGVACLVAVPCITSASSIDNIFGISVLAFSSVKVLLRLLDRLGGHDAASKQ